jgi:ABC-type branched-subunit amino acid transport system ATPase component
VALDGAPVAGGPERFARAGVARSFQQPRLVDELSVDGNVAAGALGAGRRPLGLVVLGRRPARARAASATAAVGLTVAGFRRVGTLSGGERKRVELARVLAAGARVALLDEPLAGVATADRAALMAATRSLADAGAAVVVVEHDLEAVGAVADRVLTLERGRVVA